MLVNISLKFHEDILNGLKVIERTQFCHRNCYIQMGITLKIYIQELWFVRSARRLMLVNISMKFHEDILNGFELQSGHDFVTGTDTYEIQRVITQKIYQRVMVLAICTSSNVG